jgi:hypothetical protein
LFELPYSDVGWIVLVTYARRSDQGTEKKIE